MEKYGSQLGARIAQWLKSLTAEPKIVSLIPHWASSVFHRASSSKIVNIIIKFCSNLISHLLLHFLDILEVVGQKYLKGCDCPPRMYASGSQPWVSRFSWAKTPRSLQR